MTQHETMVQMDDQVSDMNSAAYTLARSISAQGFESGSPLKLDHDDVQKLVKRIENLNLTGQKLTTMAKEQAFLKTLNFPSRPRRHDNIPIAHSLTFQWILSPSQTPTQAGRHERQRLLTWLKSGNGVFWVFGKAGSGKSTLMKFIADHDQTRRSLEHWAGPNKLVIAAYYFWAAGTTMQKSQQGLLQAMLFDILCACPELIHKVCPLQWSKTSLLDSISSKDWSIRELLDILRLLGRQPSSPRYCVFVDGLDEFDGDHFEMCQLFKELSMSPDFKFCLSSRPWNVFQDAFGTIESMKLCIHELTRPDVLAYTQSRLLEHPRWNEQYFEKQEMDSLVNGITQRAYGVFLWVFLITRSLRDGLMNGDTIQDLHKRFESLPSDLEPFFKHMLQAIDPLYHQNMGKMLQVAVNAKQAIGVQLYISLEYEEQDKDYALNKSSDSHRSQVTGALLEQWSRRLNARCGGLLEIKKDRVEFLHRTVRDFLRTREMNDFLSQKSGPDFKVNLSTLKGFVFTFKYWMQTTDWISLFDEVPLWREGLQYANDALDESEESAMMHLDAVEGLYHFASDSDASNFLDAKPDFLFRSEMLTAGVDRYVAVKLATDPSFFNNAFELLLSRVAALREWSQGHINIIARLLDHSQELDPECLELAWYSFTQQACHEENENNFMKAVDNSIFSIFLSRGAKRDIRVGELEPWSTNMLDITMLVESKDSYEIGPQFPITRFITALFHHKNSHRLSQKCLDALCDFWDTDLQRSRTQLEEIRGSLEIELQYVDRQNSGLMRLGFLARVTRCVLERAKQAGLCMRSLIPDLLTAFQGAGAPALVALAGEDSEAKLNNDCPRPISPLRKWWLI